MQPGADRGVFVAFEMNDFRQSLMATGLMRPCSRAMCPLHFHLLGMIFMGIGALKFKSGDMEAMGKNLGGSVMLFLVPKIVEVIITWAAK
jgi:hypothetical protein